ncbi:hypothetical protein ILYODFUR_014882 [Ilyodon furcidens]|uniref:Uncharacterized protein n=1 Tax=Ilyodon furcidens TaxID=33524 RepID=A0ABV0T9E1_9TELE
MYIFNGSDGDTMMMEKNQGNLIPRDSKAALISKAESSHLLEKAHFGCLYPGSHSFGHDPYLMTMGEGRNINGPLWPEPEAVDESRQGLHVADGRILGQDGGVGHIPLDSCSHTAGHAKAPKGHSPATQPVLETNVPVGRHLERGRGGGQCVFVDKAGWIRLCVCLKNYTPHLKRLLATFERQWRSFRTTSG